MPYFMSATTVAAHHGCIGITRRDVPVVERGKGGCSSSLYSSSSDAFSRRCLSTREPLGASASMKPESTNILSPLTFSCLDKPD